MNATNGVEITKITTAFGRDITKIEASSKEKEIYRNENAAEQISGSDNSHLYARLLSTANIIQNFQNLKIEPKFSLITPEMDAADARQSLYDAPFFNDEDGEVIYFEDDEMELPAIEVRPRTTEGIIKVYMLNRHLAAMTSS